MTEQIPEPRPGMASSAGESMGRDTFPPRVAAAIADGDFAKAAKWMLAWLKHPALRNPSGVLAFANLAEAANAPAEACLVLEAAIRHWPRKAVIPARLGSLCLAAGNPAAACRHLETAVAISPASLHTWLQLVRASEAHAGRQAALNILDRADACLEPQPILFVIRAGLLKQEGNLPVPNALVTDALARWPTDAKVLDVAARHLLANRRYAECVEAIAPVASTVLLSDGARMSLALSALATCQDERLLACNLTGQPWTDAGRANVLRIVLHALFPSAAIPDVANAAPHSADAFSDARAYLAKLAERPQLTAAAALADELANADPVMRPLLSQKINIDIREGRLDQAMEWLESLSKSDGVDANILHSIVHAATDLNEIPELLGKLSTVAARLENVQARTSLLTLCAETLVAGGHDGAAREILSLLPAHTPAGGGLGVRVGYLRKRLLPGLSPPAKTGEAAFEAHEVTADGVEHYRFGTGHCVIWFAGLIPGVMNALKTICLPLWERNGTSVLIIEDHRRLAALDGFGPYFLDRAASEAALRNLLESWGYRHVYTTGTSLATLSAITYGIALGAEGALAFAGPVRIPASVSEMPDARGTLSLQRLLRQLRYPLTDALPLLAANPQFHLEYHYGLHCAFDAGQAALASGLTNVTLRGADHDQHNVLWQLHSSNQLADTITRFEDALGWPRRQAPDPSR